MTDPVIEALLRERAGYAARGLTNRVAAVDAELARLGHRVAPQRETAVASPAENAMQPKPTKRRSRNG